jgi:hypothetical protein
MTMPFEAMAELHGLLDALCEETITAEQMQRLEELIRNHPEAEAHYVQYVTLYADLVRHFAAPLARTEQALCGRIAGGEERESKKPEERERDVPVSPAPRLPHSSATSRLLVWGGLAGLAAGLLFLLVQGKRSRVDSTLPDQAEATDETVAVLLQAPGAEWEENGPPRRAGSPLHPGWLRLKSGSAQIEFYSGATVILQGPAELQLVSRMEAYCARGKLRATVPHQAEGFRIGSPKLDLVDRGTEFGLQVADRTEVHVFQGKVELYDPGSDRKEAPRKELTTGQGIRLDGPGDVRPIELNPAAFQTAQQLADRSREEIRLRRENWLKASADLRKDPSLLVYYSFQTEQAWGRTVLDQARDRKQPHDGAIVGCSWATGRWAGKQGLEFKRVSDRVRFHVPGEFDVLTLMAWVRVDALPNLNNSLMMSDGWQEGGLHWQIGEAGKIILGVKAPGTTPNAHYRTAGVFSQERLGRWSHLAVVYDREAGRVTHYVDGQLVKEEPVLLDVPVRIGDAELGNWNAALFRSAQPIRHLSGCMDEFMLFTRALSGGEIERLYEQGRPPS